MHRTVLLEEVLAGLSIRPGGTYVDGTVGSAGHALEILRHAGPGGHLLGLDIDPDALACARERLAAYRDHEDRAHERCHLEDRLEERADGRAEDRV